MKYWVAFLIGEATSAVLMLCFVLPSMLIWLRSIARTLLEIRSILNLNSRTYLYFEDRDKAKKDEK